MVKTVKATLFYKLIGSTFDIQTTVRTLFIYDCSLFINCTVSHSEDDEVVCIRSYFYCTSGYAYALYFTQCSQISFEYRTIFNQQIYQSDLTGRI